MRRNRVRAAGAALLALATVVAGGCVQSAEVNQLALIDLLALDAAPDDEILVTAQVIMPTRLGVGPSSVAGEGAPFFLVQSRGRTTAEALANLQKRVPRLLFLEHLQMLVIGDELARRGLFPVLDFLIRDKEIRTDLLVAVTPGPAAALLNIASPLPAVSGEAWADLVRNERLTVSSLRNVFVSMGEEGMEPFATAIAPSVVQEPGGGADLGDMELIGAGVFRGDRLAGYLNRNEAIGLQLLLNDRPRTVISLRAADVIARLEAGRAEPHFLSEGEHGIHPAHLISLRLRRVDTSLSPVALDPPTLKLSGRLVLDVVNAASVVDVQHPEVAAAMEEVAAATFAGYVDAALRQMKALNADAAGLGASFRRSRPEWWRAMRDHWPELFPRVEMQYDLQVAVARTGLATRPAGPLEPQLWVPQQGAGRP